MKTARVRQTFLDFFKDNDHACPPSAPLIPQDDPSLLFVGAGMVPFKQYFLGQAKPPFLQAATAQKCMRAGGKHNDLEMVGRTKRHHTFFEMLGNFSFGSYFKEEAIFYAFTFLTKTLAIDPKRLYVTFYHTDLETKRLWQKISGFGDDRLIPIKTADNFWTMGAEGPCGPCTEIFYDHGAHIEGGLPGTPDEDGDRYVEIWNLVFMQFNQLKGGEREPLAKPGVDTGTGLERLAAVMQGVPDNYDTDILLALRKKAADLLRLDSDLKCLANAQQTALKVVADHVRASVFLIADGILPSNEGRGYVLRRIIRRAHRFAMQAKGKSAQASKQGPLQEPLLGGLVPTLLDEMGGAYPELFDAKALATKTLEAEETGFAETLHRAEGIFADKIKGLQRGESLNGSDAFLLYDTYGLPQDILADMLEEKGLTFDHAGFESEMKRQKETARASGRFQTGFEVEKSGAAKDVLSSLPTTIFLGYDALKSSATLLAVLKDGKRCESLSESGEALFIFDQTPFYAESGGQQGDQGTAEAKDLLIDILDTQKQSNGHQALFVHVGRIQKGVLSAQHLRAKNAFTLQVNAERRQGLKVHHSATHLLHAALRDVLGKHVMQKGSLVMQDRLRFDFSHFEKLATDQLLEVEAMVNAEIRAAQRVVTEVTSLEKAKSKGAMALFGETYGTDVRFVSMGRTASDTGAFSKELCGGTHVVNTGEMGFFKIVSESGVAKGVRRIEAVVGAAAETMMADALQTLNKAQKLLNTSQEGLVSKLEDTLKGAKRRDKVAGNTVSAEEQVIQCGEHTLLLCGTQNCTPQELRQLWDAKKNASQKVQLGLFVSFSKPKDVTKVAFLLGSTRKGFVAKDILQKIVGPLGGKAGGREDMAQGGLEDKEGSLSLKRIADLYKEAVA